MSQENVEIVRGIYEAAARRDAATALALYDPGVQWDASRGPLEGVTARGIYLGHEGLRRFFSERHDAWEQIEDEVEELIDAGDTVVSIGLARGTGRASGLQVEGRHYAVWTIQESRVVRVVWYPTKNDALEAVGL